MVASPTPRLHGGAGHETELGLCTAWSLVTPAICCAARDRSAVGRAPSGGVVLTISFGDHLRVDPETAKTSTKSCRSLIAGVHDSAVATEHAGSQHGVQVDLSPLVATACWACRRTAHSAKSSQPNEGSEFVVVTHPFHPLFGQRLEVLFERQMPAGLALSCDGGPLGRMLLPAGWTDRQEGFERSSRLSYEALAELAAVIGAARRS